MTEATGSKQPAEINPKPAAINTLARRSGMVGSSIIKIHHEPSCYLVPPAKFSRLEPLSPCGSSFFPQISTFFRPSLPVPPATPPAKSKFLSDVWVILCEIARQPLKRPLSATGLLKTFTWISALGILLLLNATSCAWIVYRIR